MRAELTRPIPMPRRIVVPKISVKWPKVDFFWVGAVAIIATWAVIAALVVLELSGLSAVR